MVPKFLSPDDHVPHVFRDPLCLPFALAISLFGFRIFIFWDFFRGSRLLHPIPCFAPRQSGKACRNGSSFATLFFRFFGRI
jgi:hypothetical protein